MLRWGFGLLLVLSLAACGGSGELDVSLSDGSPVVGTVGPEGGTVSDGDGGFELLFPGGAVAEPVEVTVSPIDGLEGLPFDGGLLAGVEVEP